MKQRTYLQKKYLKLALTEQDLQVGQLPAPDLDMAQLHELHLQEEFFSKYDQEKTLKLLQFVEMIIFHSLILLVYDEQKKDQDMYNNAYTELIKQDFINL